MKVEKVKIVSVEDVSAEEFAPYGQIMGREHGDPYETLDHLLYYTKDADLGPENEKVDGGLLVCNPNGRNIKYLERHPETAENFVPIEGECVFLMAPADNAKKLPDISRLRAFYLNGSLGVALHKGTWHWPPIPLGEKIKLVLVRKGTLWEETEFRNFDEMGIEGIEIVL
jgi:ureidoglycolate lyase